jgi:Cu+-exporting ATPase
MAQKKNTLPITGMTCVNCAATIERNLKKLDGVAEANVNFATETATVTFDPTVLGEGALISKIKDVGYDVAIARVELPITGMTCANCAATVERTLTKRVPGVVSATVNFASEKATVEYVPGQVAPTW